MRSISVLLTNEIKFHAKNPVSVIQFLTNLHGVYHRAMPHPEILKIYLRPTTNQDIPELFHHQRDPEALRMAMVYPKDKESFTKHWHTILADRNIILRSIIVDSVLVGYITCFKMDQEDSIGYWISKENWGRGIATRALTMLLEELSIRPLFARVAETNTASIKVLQNCNFRITSFKMSSTEDPFPVCKEALLRLD
jgi:RimJ/RimL family protein N-acetyltransferase